MHLRDARSTRLCNDKRIEFDLETEMDILCEKETCDTPSHHFTAMERTRRGCHRMMT